MSFDVFLSHDTQDYNLVDKIWKILDRINVNAYVYERFPDYGEYIPETLKNTIKTSTHFVTFLTRNGVLSQWVNQEIGIAHAFDKLIIPIQEKGVKSKGFVELRRYIEYDPYNPEVMMNQLITRLRGLLYKHYAIENGLTLDCSKCSNRFKTLLPSCDEVMTAIEKNQNFIAKCNKCHNEIQYSPMTLEPLV